MRNAVHMIQERPSQEETPFMQTQRTMKELPAVMKGLRKQMVEVSNVTKHQLKAMQKQTEVSEKQLFWMEQLHSRLDTLMVESRATNLLLSELIALQQVVITEDVTDQREAIRAEVYQRILRGE